MGTVTTGQREFANLTRVHVNAPERLSSLAGVPEAAIDAKCGVVRARIRC